MHLRTSESKYEVVSVTAGGLFRRARAKPVKCTCPHLQLATFTVLVELMSDFFTIESRWNSIRRGVLINIRQAWIFVLQKSSHSTIPDNPTYVLLNSFCLWQTLRISTMASGWNLAYYDRPLFCLPVLLYLINGEHDPGTRFIIKMTPWKSRELSVRTLIRGGPAFYFYLQSFLNLEPVLSEVTLALHKVHASELRCEKMLKIKTDLEIPGIVCPGPNR